MPLLIDFIYWPINIIAKQLIACAVDKPYLCIEGVRRRLFGYIKYLIK